MSGDRPLVGHPQDGPVGALAAELQHARAERGEQHGGRREVGDVEGIVHAEKLVVDIDGTGTSDLVYLHKDGPRLYFQRVPEGKTAMNRLVAAGATVAWELAEAKGNAIVMRDPEGNEFCVT